MLDDILNKIEESDVLEPYEYSLLKRYLCFDELTGLPNRRMFELDVGKALQEHDRYGRVFCIAYIDVDNFKSINDMHGHYEGDCALRQLASEMNANVRKSDRVYRLHGDEFSLLMPETDIKTGDMVCDRLTQKLSYKVSYGCIDCTISEDYDILIYSADARMYEKKHLARE